MKNKNFWKGLLTLIFQGIAPVMFFKAPSAIQNAYGFWFFFGIATCAGIMIGGMIDSAFDWECWCFDMRGHHDRRND